MIDPSNPCDVRRGILKHVLELSGADYPHRNVRNALSGADYRVEAVQWAELADEETRKRLARLPRRVEDVLLGAEETYGYSASWYTRELGQIRGMNISVGD